MQTKLRRGGLRGSPTPRVSSFPGGPRDFSVGEDAILAAEIAGRESMAWQELVVREGMSTKADSDAWAAFEVGVLVSRQNGKNGAIEVVELGWMVNEPGVSILHTAHEFQTALESMDKLEALIRSHPLLEREISSVRRGNGKESIRLKNGSVIRFRTRTKSGGRGFSVDRLVIDEAMIWSPASQAAILPLLTTAQRPQIWYLGSAADVDTHEYCAKWASLRARALAGDDEGLIWLEWSAPDPPKGERARAEWRSDRSNWAASNPGLGELLTEDYIDAEIKAFRANLEKWEIERLSVGKWPALNGVISEIPAENWRDMLNASAKLTGPRALVLTREGTWAITAAQRTVEGKIHIEVGYADDALASDVVLKVVEVMAAWDPSALIVAPGAAAEVQAELELLGYEVTVPNRTEEAQACGGFLSDALASGMSHSGQEGLTNAVGNAVKHELPSGGFVWEVVEAASHAQLRGATLARWALMKFGQAPKRKTVAPRTGAKVTQRRRRTNFDAMTASF